MMQTFMRSLVITLLLICPTPLCAALTPDNLLLVVNKNVPDSQKLAEYYAQQRHVPDGRIVSLDLPTGDNISVEEFDQKMVAPIRQFISENKLQSQVTCIVNFYGVPLRIPGRTNDLDLREELVSLRKQQNQAMKLAAPM